MWTLKAYCYMAELNVRIMPRVYREFGTLSIREGVKMWLYVEYNSVRESSVESRFKNGRTKVGKSGTSRGLLLVYEVKPRVLFHIYCEKYGNQKPQGDN